MMRCALGLLLLGMVVASPEASAAEGEQAFEFSYGIYHMNPTLTTGNSEAGNVTVVEDRGGLYKLEKQAGWMHRTEFQLHMRNNKYIKLLAQADEDFSKLITLAGTVLAGDVVVNVERVKFPLQGTVLNPQRGSSELFMWYGGGLNTADPFLERSDFRTDSTWSMLTLDKRVAPYFHWGAGWGVLTSPRGVKVELPEELMSIDEAYYGHDTVERAVLDRKGRSDFVGMHMKMFTDDVVSKRCEAKAPKGCVRPSFTVEYLYAIVRAPVSPEARRRLEATYPPASQQWGVYECEQEGGTDCDDLDPEVNLRARWGFGVSGVVIPGLAYTRPVGTGEVAVGASYYFRVLGHFPLFGGAGERPDYDYEPLFVFHGPGVVASGRF